MVRALLEREFPLGEQQYRAWFLELIGILGDPVAGRARIAAAKLSGTKLADNGYGYKRAFTVSPEDRQVDRLHRLAACGRHDYSRKVLDPFAGGGSIPFEAVRYGCDSVANELNPVASAVLTGTITLPLQFGSRLPQLIDEYGREWTKLLRDSLGTYFPLAERDTGIIGYVWAHAIPCPETGFPTPLIPNLWLANTQNKRVAVRITGDSATGEVRRELVTGDDAAAVGPTGTYKGGKATSIFTGQVIESSQIQQRANEGELSEILLAVVVTRPGVKGRAYRLPTEDDLAAVDAATVALKTSETQLELEGLLPTEEVPRGKETKRCLDMGITTWRAMFTPRQQLSHATALRSMARVVSAASERDGAEAANAVALCLYMAIAKGLNFNSRLASWINQQEKVRSTFDRHDFAFKHTFAEFDAARSLGPWVLDQIEDSERGITRLIAPSSQQDTDGSSQGGRSRVIGGSAAALSTIESQSIDAIVTDPPYYDNVMYSECSDYFYVWMKRALRESWPEYCALELTDKQGEAVANPSLYTDLATHAGRGKRGVGTKTAADLAEAHYERLLRGAWREAHRVLRDDGVMTVMFTHKRVTAWDTLGASLLDAGFSVESSWPVRTEFEHSLHQAKKNSASSTILLTCRKRGSTAPAFFSDLRPEIQRTARDAATRFARDGLSGIDLTLATYGPVLSVLSASWPVFTGQLDTDGNREVIRPEEALMLAYEEVARLKKRALLGGKDTPFDPQTDWYLTAWNDFRAAEFPAGEALKLSLATHVDLDDVERARRLIATKAGWAALQTPAERVSARKLDPDDDVFDTQVDRLHALMYVYQHDGMQAARTWLARRGWQDDRTLQDLVQAAANAIPRTHDAKGFVREEARVLDGLAATLFPDIELVPVSSTERAQQTLAV
ncbi:MAG: hypothetical protein ABSG95_12575 [Solirubrobacteraceae bacterium]|jgi:adenine-specific DNA methylase